MGFKAKFNPSFIDEKEEFGKTKRESTKDSLKNDAFEPKFKPVDKDKRPILRNDKEESKFDRIDWSKPYTEKIPPDKFDNIDWGKNAFQKQETDNFDKIDWKKSRGLIKGDKTENIKKDLNDDSKWDFSKSLENIAYKEKYVRIEKNHLKTILSSLKKIKKYSQKEISEKIGYNIGTVFNRGYPLPYKSYNKLNIIANSINKNLEYTNIIHKPKYNIQSMQKLASIIGKEKTGTPGKCLSENYLGMNKPLNWECGKCGREWQATPNGILYQYNWCRACSGKETWTYYQMVNLAKSRGLSKTGVEGKFLTPKNDYENQEYPDRSKYKWKCGKCGNEWEASANNVKRGSWCRDCQYDKLSQDFREPFSEIQKLAENIGKIKTGYPGKFFTDKKEYKGVRNPSHHKFQWWCGKCENSFEMDITHVKRPQWCPICTEGESESICRGYFERIFHSEFPKAYPTWLKNPATGGQMHLDGYNEDLKVAFEYNGPQHYKMYPKYHKSHQDFVHQLELDKIKAELCEKKDITLISVPYWLDYDQFPDYINEEYKKETNKVIKNNNKYDWREFKKENLDLDKYI